MERKDLTKAQLQFLESLNHVDQQTPGIFTHTYKVTENTWSPLVEAELVERQPYATGRSKWRITPAGKALHNAKKSNPKRRR